jgi:ribonucleoside-diphosphate reductase alpha chain
MDTIVTEACRHLTNVDPEPVLKDALRNLFNQAKLQDVHKALIMSARALIEREPNYTYVSARLLLDSMRHEALMHLTLGPNATFDEMAQCYPSYFKSYIAYGIQQDILDPELAKFNLDKLSKALLPERDMLFTYLGLQTLYDRYFIHESGVRYELPQAFFMRVAMGLASQEKNRDDRAIEFLLIAVVF